MSALDLTVTQEDLAAIDALAPVGVAAGQRYAEQGMATLHR